MRTIFFSTLIILTLFISSMPVFADPRQRDIEERLDHWVDFAENQDFRVLDAFIDDIEHTRYYNFELGPGEYHLYAEGGRFISDLDMTVYDDDGWEIGSDTMADNYPTVSFNLRDWTDVEIEIEVWSYEGWHNEGSFCLVISREGGRDRDDRRGRDDDRNHCGGDRGRGRGDDRGWRDDDHWDNGRGYGRDRDRGDEYNFYDDRDSFRDWDSCRDDWFDWWSDGSHNTYYDTGWDRDMSIWQRRDIVEDKLGYLYDFADHRGLNPIFETVEDLEDTLTFAFDLEPGYYVVFGAGGPYIEDLDLAVNWTRGYREHEIAEDIGFDAYPAVWFYIPEFTTIEIELEIYRFNSTHFEDYACLLLCRG